MAGSCPYLKESMEGFNKIQKKIFLAPLDIVGAQLKASFKPVEQHSNIVARGLIVHGPDDFRWTFLLTKAPYDFSIKYNLKFKKNRGSPILGFVFSL